MNYFRMRNERVEHTTINNNEAQDDLIRSGKRWLMLSRNAKDPMKIILL